MPKFKTTVAACLAFSAIGGIIACSSQMAKSRDSEAKTSANSSGVTETVPTAATTPAPSVNQIAGADDASPATQLVGPYKDFKGTIKLDVRDSKADWGPFTPKKAPAGTPNILFVLYDDTGLAAWSPYGGRINMPTLDRLAKRGLTYTQFHTCALCSPTRSTLLTGATTP